MENVQALTETWILPALLGLGLAAASGLRIFVPLLATALVAKFGLFGIELNESMAWATSNGAIAALAIATVVEIVADKVPVLDNALHTLGIVARPVAGAVVAGSVFAGLDPTTAAIAGIIVGAPTALAFGAAQGGARAASTATTGGLGNPILSVIEDVLSFFTVAIALFFPVIVPLFLALLFWAVWRLFRKVRPRRVAVEPAP